MKRGFKYLPTAFISGTFADMEGFRQAAYKFLRQADIAPIDLAMSANSNDTTEDYINGDLDDTHLLVGIYGLRYGTLKNNSSLPPSWSHHEYARHRVRVSLFSPHERVKPETFILYPAPDSDAAKEAVAQAETVYNAEGLSNSERAADKELQLRFMRVVRGEEPDFAPPVEGYRAPSVNVALQNRITASFRNVDDLRAEIGAYLTRISFARRLILEEPPMETPTPAVASLPVVRPTKALLERLAPKVLPAGVCVVVPKLEGVPSAVGAASLADANPWGVEEPDDLLDVSGNRGTSVLRILQDFADSQFSVTGDDIESLCKAIAQNVASYQEPEMFRIINVPRGFAIAFLRDVWPLLFAHLNAERLRSSNADAGLLLVLASDSAAAKLKPHCQEVGGTLSPHSKPHILTAAALGLPKQTPDIKAQTESPIK